MTDKELLELAAKAAGMSVMWVDSHDIGLMDANIVPLPLHAQHFAIAEYPYIKWNPLSDDGDALRLAVKLGISIYPYPVYSHEKHSVVAKRHLNGDTLRQENPTEVVEIHNGNPMAATRRAIVRAAANIGRTM